MKHYPKQSRVIDPSQDLSDWSDYSLYFWYDGPMLFTVGSGVSRFMFIALPDDERSERSRMTPYMVVPMTLKRERDIVDNKLTLRQAVMHSQGAIYKSWDNGKTLELITDVTTSELSSKGARLCPGPAFYRKMKSLRLRRKQKARKRRD
jgi:hypothetical protein